MKIRVTNEEKTKAVLDAIQERCRTRILEPADLTKSAQLGERFLGKLCIPKESRVDCLILIKPPKVANSYNGIAEGTFATLQRFPTGWFLVDASRRATGTKRNGGNWKDVLYLSCKAFNSLPTAYEL